MANKSIDRKILALAWPAILEMMMHTLVWTIDTAMIGRLTPSAITGVNLGAQIMFTVANIIGALGVGATAMVARNIGSKDIDRAEFIAVQAVSISMIISIVTGVAGIALSESVLELIVKDLEVIRLGTDYLRIVFAGVFFLIPLLVTNSILRGAGNTVVPLISASVANVFNIIGDYVLIFGKFGFPQLGVKGAAIATASAQILGLAISMFFLIRGTKGIRLKVRSLFRFNRDTVKSLVRLSIPAGMETLINEGSRLISSFCIAQLGTIAFAANSLAVAAESISFMPGYGFTVAAAALVGQNLGANDLKSAEKITKRSTLHSATLMGIVGVLFFIIPYQLMRLFSTNLETVSIAAKCIRVGAFEQIPIAISMTVSGALKGAGDTKGPFRISIIANFFVRLPLIFLIVFVLKLNIIYVWAATVLQYIVQGLLMVYRYKKGHWKTVDIR